VTVAEAVIVGMATEVAVTVTVGIDGTAGGSATEVTVTVSGSPTVEGAV